MCKSKWKSLRESYRKAMNARKTKSGQAAKKIKPWRLENQMEFIKPHLFSQSDDQTSNFSPPPDSPRSVASAVHDLSQETDDSSSMDKSHEQIENPQSIQSVSSGRDTPLSSAPAKKNLNSKPIPPTSAAEMLRQYLNMKAATSTEAAYPNEDHLTKYFQSIEETVRTLPPRIQIRLKSQISELVHNAELEALNVNSSFPPPPLSYCISNFTSAPSAQQPYLRPSPTAPNNQNHTESNVDLQHSSHSQTTNQSFSSPPTSNYSQFTYME